MIEHFPSKLVSLIELSLSLHCFVRMKYSEFHRAIMQKGWVRIRQNGSHVIYEKDGIREVVPNHGSDEFPKGLQKRLTKRMGL